MKNYYETLGVPEDASDEDIKKIEKVRSRLRVGLVKHGRSRTFSERNDPGSA